MRRILRLVCAESLMRGITDVGAFLPWAAARSLLKTVHWTVFRARRTPHAPSGRMLFDERYY